MNNFTLGRVTLMALLLNAAPVFAMDIVTPHAHDTAPTNGWASVEGETTGGANADKNSIYIVTSKHELIAALNDNPGRAKIVQLSGQIDISAGQPYTSADDQRQRGIIYIPSNVTLIGVNDKAGVINGSLVLKDVSNVILRNFRIETPRDVAPQFEEGDGWNAEWDGASILSSDHVWVDHLTFTDGQHTVDQYETKEGWKYVLHDGSLDIKQGSNYVTVSNTLFEQHDKNILIGHSDNNGAQDQDRLKVTFHHNLFRDITQRSPRVRFGQVHAYNNLYVGDTDASPYPFLYTIGVGKKSHVLSEANVFNIQGIEQGCDLIKVWGGEQFLDKGSYLNQHPVSFTQNCGLSPDIGWTPPYSYELDSASEVAASVPETAGAGKL